MTALNREGYQMLVEHPLVGRRFSHKEAGGVMKTYRLAKVVNLAGPPACLCLFSTSPCGKEKVSDISFLRIEVSPKHALLPMLSIFGMSLVGADMMTAG